MPTNAPDSGESPIQQPPTLAPHRSGRVGGCSIAAEQLVGLAALPLPALVMVGATAPRRVAVSSVASYPLLAAAFLLSFVDVA